MLTINRLNVIGVSVLLGVLQANDKFHSTESEQENKLNITKLMR